jgi:FkbM family methyltransferase
LRKFSYSAVEKLLFYVSYFYYKLILPFEVKSPRWKLWLYEWIYSLKNLIAQVRGEKFPPSYLYPFRDKLIRTRFGSFKIRPGTSDAANVSPAFERRDVNYLFRAIRGLLKKGKKVLFLDIGGDLGTYSVAVAKKFRDVGIACFEPVPESCRFIRENLKLNRVEKQVRLYPYALSDADNRVISIRLNQDMPGSSSTVASNWKTAQKFRDIKIRTKKLDTLVGKELKKYDTVIFKIDVEGMETKVLLGSKKTLSSGKGVLLMVEDFVEPSIIRYLEKTGFGFVAKKTDYNSWWRK